MLGKRRGGAEPCLTSQMGDVMIAVDLQTVWVFPERRVLLYVRNGMGEARVLRAVARLNIVE